MSESLTSEQLQLLQKLKTTGISQEQIVQALTDLNQRQERETPPMVESPQKVKPAKIFAPILIHHLSTRAAQTSSSPTACERMSMMTVPEPSAPAPAPTMLTAVSYEPTARPVRSQRTPMREITTLDDPAELDEFMEKGEEECIADMKHFITQYSLRQTTVAMMTGVSQPYISKLLNGNHRELSLRCRKNIYCWYLNCRRHPQKLAVFLSDPSSRLETNGDGELVPQKRERYVFRPILIRMLEGFFAQTPFPDLNRRNEIAAACNHVLQLDKKGAGLSPKEIVSPQVVSNWFANKRKEMRRKSNAQNANASPSTTPPSREETVISMASSPNREEDMPYDLSINNQLLPSSIPVFAAQPPVVNNNLDLLSLVQRIGVPPQPILPIDMTTRLLAQALFAQEQSKLPITCPDIFALFANSKSELEQK